VDNLSAVESIFFAALDKSSHEERAAYLDQACGPDLQLRGRVERMLKVKPQIGAFLQAPAPALGPTVDAPPLTEKAGTIIGPYKLLQEIGEGGFGVVYMAEQDKPVRRMVALKIVKPGMDTAQVIARFESERQALALMDHPHIAKVFDAGATESGRPYFVMELIRGVPITEFCDKNHLPPEARLKLFIAVCHAVQHAHHKGVIHRDIKPSNVMVTLHDGVPVVKVIDFGVAKATVQKLTEKTLFTAYGQMIGTPAYMSPEQAEMSGLDIDTRSDVYSLGVLLYELLTGTTPLESNRLRQAGYAEMQRLIREEEAPRPSTRLSSLGQSATLMAGNRGLDAKGLARLLAGDLDWIVMKALEKDRNRRYGAPGNFAEDIDRYLRGDAILARPPSTAYKVKKLAQRNRAAVMTAAVVAVALLGGTALATWQAVAARKAEAQALAERDEKEFARKDAAAARKEAEGAADRLRQATVQIGIGITCFQQRRWSAAQAAFAKAEGLQADLVPIYVFRSWMYEGLGLWDLAAADQAKLSALFGGGIGWDSESSCQRALLRFHVGDESGYREACRLMIKRYCDDQSDNPDSSNLAQLQSVRACVLSAKFAVNPADLARRVEQIVSREPVPWHLYIAGLAHYRAGNYAQAVARLAQALSGDWAARAISYPCLAMAYHRMGRAGEARQALAAAEKAIDEWTEMMMSNPVGTLPLPWYDWLECQHFYGEAKQMLTGSLPPTESRLQRLRERALATLSLDDAMRLLANRKAKLGPDHPDTLTCMQHVAEGLAHAGRSGDAVALIDECVQRAGSKSIGVQLLPVLIELRFRHFERAKDAAGCRQTAEMWEKEFRATSANLYNAACYRAVTAGMLRATDSSAAAAKQGTVEADRAMAWLKQAVGAGWSDAAHMATDRDLDAVRDREDFKKLLDEMKTRGATGRKESKTSSQP
jgi:serine/threonine protein kinase/tetratricopeptide (TPR) repeat protein